MYSHKDVKIPETRMTSLILTVFVLIKYHLEFILYLVVEKYMVQNIRQND